MFTVFGATGHTGAVVVQRLLAARKQVRVVVRDAGKAPAGTDVVVGDVTDRAVVIRALAGVAGAYLMAPPDLQSADLIARSRAIADNYAAGVTGVPHVVVLSSVGAQHASGIGPAASNHVAEVALRATAGAVTFVRAPFFMENLLGNAHLMKTEGVLPVFGGGEQYAFPMIATRDIGNVAADALLAPASGARWLELRGPRDYSFADAAAIASRVLGRPVAAKALPLDAMIPALVGAGFSPQVAALFREMTEGVQRGLFTYEHPERVVTGAVPLEDVLAALR